MTTANISYGNATAVTFTTANLASDTNLLVGRQSDLIDNTTTLAIDYFLGGKVTAGTGPTASRQIEYWVAATFDGANLAGGLTGSDGACTLTAETKTLLRLATIIPTDNTSNRVYQFGGISIAGLFDNIVPPKFAIFEVQNTGVALNVTAANHAVYVQAVKFTSA